ncbi:MAG: undecaprenyl-phosphate glucose phosphotransferase [Prevotella sp.]|nr:undecaprenyl-phosphate glucose phosphotransferase [Prevotella sp.]
MRAYSNGNDMIKSLVIVGDFVALNVLLLLFLHIFSDWLPLYFRQSPRLAFLSANFAMLISQYYFQTILHYRRVGFDVILKRLLKLTFTQSFLMFFFLRIIYNKGGFFWFMFVYGTALFLLLTLMRIIERGIINHYRQMGRNTRNVIFIGNDPATLELYKDMIADSTTGYVVKGYYADEKNADWPSSFGYLGTIADFNTIMDDVMKTTPMSRQVPTVDEIFCCLSHDESDEVVRIMRYCDKNIIHFFYVPRKFGNFRLNLQPEQFGNMSIFTNHREPLTVLGNRFVKRLFDIVFSLLVCLCLLPFIPFIALIIKLQSPGPVFFKQARTGLNGKTFMCYKFRSMHINEDADLSQATLDDPRKFPFGRLMRKTNLDEFPQFYNVLKGDMSIVGPRPHMLYHTEIYSELINKYMVRHFCRPGITGWAQVCGYRGETKELWQMEERVNHDIWYIENWTFWLDLRIISMTALTVLFPDKKAY